MLCSALDMPASVFCSVTMSSSNVDANLLELSFKALAISRIEFVKSSCSAFWFSMMASAVAVVVSGSEGFWRFAKRAARAVVCDEDACGDGVGCTEGRDRSVCVVCVGVALGMVDAGGGRGSCVGMGSGVGGSGGVSRICESSRVSEDRESMLSLGVGMMCPRRSSSSELLSSSTAIYTTG